MSMTLAMPPRRSDAHTAPSVVYVPPGWPEPVRPPGAARWEETAVEFLLDCCPAGYRAYPVLRHHPVVLARFAVEFVESQRRAGLDVLAGLRASLRGHVSPEVVQRAADLCQEQDAILARTKRAVGLLEEALRGRVFVRPL